MIATLHRPPTKWLHLHLSLISFILFQFFFELIRLAQLLSGFELSTFSSHLPLSSFRRCRVFFFFCVWVFDFLNFILIIYFFFVKNDELMSTWWRFQFSVEAPPPIVTNQRHLRLWSWLQLPSIGFVWVFGGLLASVGFELDRIGLWFDLIFFLVGDWLVVRLCWWRGRCRCFGGRLGPFHRRRRRRCLVFERPSTQIGSHPLPSGENGRIHR